MEGHRVAVCEETALSATRSPVRALVGGLAYYTGRRITLLEPPGFVPPTYLAGRSGGMFLSRAAFERRWRAGERLAPPPIHVLGGFGDRWLLASFPATDGR